MRPARHFRDWPRHGAGGVVECFEPGIGVGLEKAREPRQMSRRMGAAPIGARQWLRARGRRIELREDYLEALDARRVREAIGCDRLAQQLVSFHSGMKGAMS